MRYVMHYIMHYVTHCVVHLVMHYVMHYAMHYVMHYVVHLVHDARRRDDQVEVELSLEPLLHHLHVQQPQEAAPGGYVCVCVHHVRA